VKFTLGFGRAMMHAMKAYVAENRHIVEAADEPPKKAVVR